MMRLLCFLLVMSSLLAACSGGSGSTASAGSDAGAGDEASASAEPAADLGFSRGCKTGKPVAAQKYCPNTDPEQPRILMECPASVEKLAGCSQTPLANNWCCLVPSPTKDPAVKTLCGKLAACAGGSPRACE